MTMAYRYQLHERLVFMLRFVKAQFPNSQKHYDYICGLDDIQKGDLVFVMTQYGKKLVTVRGIFYSELEDMPLPGYAYKRILEKFVPDPPLRFCLSRRESLCTNEINLYCIDKAKKT